MSSSCAGGKLLLGYPASPSGASSGYLSPSAVVNMVHALAANSTPIAGLMTWSIGCDSTPNEFRSQRCLSHAPKRQSYGFLCTKHELQVGPSSWVGIRRRGCSWSWGGAVDTKLFDLVRTSQAPTPEAIGREIMLHEVFRGGGGGGGA
jgi:hypothetical protein